MLRIRQLLRLSCALLLATASAAQAQVVISQVYGGGGNTGAPFNRDFIELFNSGGTAVAIGGWSVHYASTTGTFTTNKTDIPAGVTLQPGQYYLVGGGSGANGVALPTVDVSGAINLSGTAGKVALTNTNAQLGVSCPSGGALVDFVGFGAAANCSETAPTANLSNTTAAIRANTGCTDTGSNVADFALATPTPRNSGSPLNPCGGGGSPALSIGDVTLAEGDAGTSTATFTVSLNFPAGAGGVSFDIATSDGSATTADGDYVANAVLAQSIAEGSANATFTVTINGDAQVESTESFTVNVSNVTGATLADGQALGTLQNDDFVIVPVHAIQGNGDVSPYAVNSIVATEGIVTARTSNGFFLQTPDAEADMDAGSSEGVFVFTSAAPPASAAVGNRVRVNATLDEYNPGGQLPLTELKNATVIQVSTGNPLPAPIVLTDADANATSPVDQLERYEGMRVSIPSLRVTAPVDGNISEAAATSTSNGIFYGVLPTVARPFREPGIDVLDPVTIPGGLTPPLFDHNPENIRVRSTGQVGATLLSVDVGDIVNNLVGVLDYGFGSYTMMPDPGAGASVVLGSTVTAVPARAADEITIGGFNLLRFFDDVADGNGATKLTTAAYQFRLKKTANAICAFTRNPDILGVVEVEHIKALSELATSINSNQGNLLFPDACTGNPGYVAYLVEGNDVGGIDVGFLLKTEEVAPGKPRVEVLSIDQLGKDALFTNADNSTELLNDRPPLVLVARINAANGASQTVTVIANHLRSLIDVNSTATGTRGWPTVGDRVRAKARRAGAVPGATDPGPPDREPEREDRPARRLQCLRIQRRLRRLDGRDHRSRNRGHRGAALRRQPDHHAADQYRRTCRASRALLVLVRRQCPVARSHGGQPGRAGRFRRRPRRACPHQCRLRHRQLRRCRRCRCAFPTMTRWCCSCARQVFAAPTCQRDVVIWPAADRLATRLRGQRLRCQTTARDAAGGEGRPCRSSHSPRNHRHLAPAGLGLWPRQSDAGHRNCRASAPGDGGEFTVAVMAARRPCPEA